MVEVGSLEAGSIIESREDEHPGKNVHDRLSLGKSFVGLLLRVMALTFQATINSIWD